MRLSCNREKGKKGGAFLPLLKKNGCKIWGKGEGENNRNGTGLGKNGESVDSQGVLKKQKLEQETCEGKESS